MAAAGRAPRLRRTAEACRLVASFPCAPSRRAGGGIAAAPRVRTGRTRHGKHAPCACMRPLRAPCVPSLCAGLGSLLRVPALRMPACPYCVHGALVQFVVDMYMLEPMPAARAHAMRARAVRLRAGRVVHLCSFLPDRAASARQRLRHRVGAPARALFWRCACLRCRACVSHARVACTRYVYACCACFRYCALAFPMLALCAPALRALALRARAMRPRVVCGVLVQRSTKSCGARSRYRHHTLRRPRRPDMPSRRPTRHILSLSLLIS